MLARTLVLFVLRTPCTPYSKKVPYSVLFVLRTPFILLRTPYSSYSYSSKMVVLRTNSYSVLVVLLNLKMDLNCTPYSVRRTYS